MELYSSIWPHQKERKKATETITITETITTTNEDREEASTQTRSRFQRLRVRTCSWAGMIFFEGKEKTRLDRGGPMVQRSAR